MLPPISVSVMLTLCVFVIYPFIGGGSLMKDLYEIPLYALNGYHLTNLFLCERMAGKVDTGGYFLFSVGNDYVVSLLSAGLAFKLCVKKRTLAAFAGPGRITVF